MVPISHILDAITHLILPAFVAALAGTTATSLAGPKQGPAAIVLGLASGAGVGMGLNHTLPTPPGAPTLNLLPWAAGAALVVGRLAHSADVLFADGWLVRGGASLAVAYGIISATARNGWVWITPAFAILVFALWEMIERLASLPGSFSLGVCLAASHFIAGAVLLFAG